MNRNFILLVSSLFLFSSWSFVGPRDSVEAEEPAMEKPNIVFILADDVGLGDVSFHARNITKTAPFVETPNIDALAEQGLWFTDGHSATALCAPTRYAVMSGNNNYRCYSPGGVWSNTTAAELLINQEPPIRNR